MDFVFSIIHKLPLPKNIVFRILVALFYFSIAIYALPFFIGAFMALYIYKKSDGKTLKYGLSALVLLLSFATGTAWMAGFSDTNSSTTQASVIGAETSIPSATPNESSQETADSPTPTEEIKVSATSTPTTVPTKIKLNTPTPTKKLVFPTATPKPFFPTRTPVPFYDGGDKDCADFSTHAEAQAFFIANGGPSNDPHRLDGNDNDGLACESLP